LSLTLPGIFIPEKSRDWMLKRLRQAKQEYNVLLKGESRRNTSVVADVVTGVLYPVNAERNRLFENWDNGTMSQSLASMSNASSYTLDLKESLKHAALGGLKLNTENYSTQAHSRVQVEFSVKRQGSVGSLPALSTKMSSSQSGSVKAMNPWDNLPVDKTRGAAGSARNVAEMAKSLSLPALQPSAKVLSKSKSGPALLVETFANGVNSFGGRKSRGGVGVGGDGDGAGSLAGDSGPIPVVEQPAEDVDEKLALARLIALRARRKEVREFLQSCSKSLHRGPWCRVKARYYRPDRYCCILHTGSLLGI
jgi:hypothetical protein